MRILTLNTWGENGPWRDRWRLIFAWLEKNRPELVGFQEIFTASLAEEIVRQTGYPHAVFPKEHSGLVFLSRFPVAEWECMIMKTQSPTEDYLRYALFAEIATSRGKLAVFNTHLSWKLDESGIRQAQVQELADFMDRRAGKLPACVMGDFNATPDSPEIKHLTEERGFADAYGYAHPGEAGLTWDNRNDFTRSHAMPARRIDYLFITGFSQAAAVIKDAQIVLNEPDAAGIWPSDHFGLRVHLEREKRGDG